MPHSSSNPFVESLRTLAGRKSDPGRVSAVEHAPPSSAMLPIEGGSTLEDLQASVASRVRDLPDASNPMVELLCIVAQSDGTIDEDEIAALAGVFGALFGGHLHAAVVKHLIRSSLDEVQHQGVGIRIRNIAATLSNFGLGEETLTLGLAVAFASRGLSGQERAMLTMFSDAAGIGRDRFEVLVSSVGAELESRK